MVFNVNHQTTPFWSSWCSILSQQQFSELNLSKGGRKTREPGRKHHQILHSSRSYQVVASTPLPDTKEMVPRPEFNSRLTSSIRNTGELPSKTLAKESASYWTLTPRLVVYVNKWEVNIWCLRGARELGRGHMLTLCCSQRKLKQELWNWCKFSEKLVWPAFGGMDLCSFSFLSLMGSPGKL